MIPIRRYCVGMVGLVGTKPVSPNLFNQLHSTDTCPPANCSCPLGPPCPLGGYRCLCSVGTGKSSSYSYLKARCPQGPLGPPFGG